MNTMITDCAWVILAGGQASRMKGADKGFSVLFQKPFIEHVFERLNSQTDHIFISANRNIEQYQRYAPVIVDSVKGYQGPIVGFYSAFQHIDKEWIGFVPCDCPFISADLVERFTSAINNQVDIIIAHDGEYPQPVFTAINRRVIPQIESCLDQQQRKLAFLHQKVRCYYIDFSDSKTMFINLNTPEDIINATRGSL
jgi:molybdopterin-guanine dinucleotide biosynthesis protein A